MLSLVLTLLVSQTHTKWEASAQLQVRTRTGTPQDVAQAVSGDVEVTPRAAGALFNGRWTLTGFYAPTIRGAEPWVLTRNGRAFADHSHVAGIEGAWTKESVARLFVGEYFRYGLFDLSTLQSRNSPTAPTTPTPAPIQGVRGTSATELTTDSSAGFDLYLTKRLTLATTGGFLYTGGADAQSREALPLYSAPRIASKLTWLGSPVDTVSVGAGVQYIRFYQVPASASNPVAKEGARTVLADAAVSYQRLLSERTGVDVTVGVSGMFGQIPDASNALQNVAGVAPLLGAGINHRALWRGQQLDLRADAKLAPFVDRQTGSVYTRAEGGAGASWSNADHVSLSVGAGVARSLPTNDVAITTISGEGGAGYQGDPWWRLDLSGRVAGLHSPPGISSIPMPAPYPGDTIPRVNPWQTQFVVALSFTAMIGSDQPRTFSQ